MKKVVFVFIAMLCIALTGCSYFGELFSCDEPEPQKKTQDLAQSDIGASLTAR